MSSPPAEETARQIEELQREIADLRRRVVALERLVGTGSEHPTDRTVVERKVSYDWQS
jgi:hypothetical protein